MADKFKAPDNLESYTSHYDEDSFWTKITNEAGKVGGKAIYIALVLYYTAMSESTSIARKSMIFGGLGYLLLPLDIIPDFIAVVGYTDDIAVLTALISTVATSITEYVKATAIQKYRSMFPNGLKEDELKSIL